MGRLRSSRARPAGAPHPAAGRRRGRDRHPRPDRARVGNVRRRAAVGLLAGRVARARPARVLRRAGPDARSPHRVRKAARRRQARALKARSAVLPSPRRAGIAAQLRQPVPRGQPGDARALRAFQPQLQGVGSALAPRRRPAADPVLDPRLRRLAVPPQQRILRLAVAVQQGLRRAALPAAVPRPSSRSALGRQRLGSVRPRPVAFQRGDTSGRARFSDLRRPPRGRRGDANRDHRTVARRVRDRAAGGGRAAAVRRDPQRGP